MIDLAIAGVTPGAAYALIAVCLVLAYRLLGVLSFSLGAFGAFGTYTMQVLFGVGVPYPLAFLVGMLAAGGMATVVGLIMTKWFYDSTSEVRTSVAIALLIAILALGFRLFGRQPRALPAPLDGWNVAIGGVNVAGSTLVLLVVTVAFTGAVALLLQRTSYGAQLRAISQRPVTAELLGVPARRLVLAAWIISGLVAGFVVTWVAPTAPGDFQTLSLLIIPAMAGALIAGLKNIWIALVGGLAMGIVGSLLTQSADLRTFGQVLPFLVIVVALLWMSRKERWDAAR